MNRIPQKAKKEHLKLKNIPKALPNIAIRVLKNSGR